MEIALGWVILALFVALGLNFLHHIIKYKTDPYYRFQVKQAAQISEFERDTSKLRGMSPRSGNSQTRKFVRGLVGKW